MSNNGTDRDLALKLVSGIDNITSLVDVINRNLYGPLITAQPQNATGAVDDVVYFAITATKQTGYQWQYNPGTGWINSAATGYNTNRLRITVSDLRYTYLYRCIVYGANNAQVISDTAKIIPNS